MYRTPPPNFPPPPDPLLVVPGEGLRGIWVGRATAADVLREFGEDCQVNRHDHGDIFSITYASDASDEYLPMRPGQDSKPYGYDFEFGLLKAIHIGPYQTALRIAGGLDLESTRDDVLRVFGLDFTSLTYDTLETLRYVSRGILVTISKGSGVSGFTVFRAIR